MSAWYYLCESCGHFWMEPERPERCENCSREDGRTTHLIRCNSLDEAEDFSQRVITGAS